MDTLVVLKDCETGLYYSDKVFIEPNKSHAERLRLGQANALKHNFSRQNHKKYIIENIE